MPVVRNGCVDLSHHKFKCLKEANMVITASGLIVNDNELSEVQARLIAGEAERQRQAAAALAARQELNRNRQLAQARKAREKAAARKAKALMQAQA